MAKNKLKSHSKLKKVLKVRGSGTIGIGHPGTRHNLGDKSTKTNRKRRKGSTLSKADYNRAKNLIK